MTAFIRSNARSLVLATGTVLVGIVLGLAVSSVMRPPTGGELAAASTGPSPLPSRAFHTRPPATPLPTRRPTPTPAPVPSVEPVPSVLPSATTPPLAVTIPTPLPAVDIDGADPAAVRAIEGAVAALDDLDAYRTDSSVFGRDLVDVSKDSFLDLGEQGMIRRRPVEAFDLQVGFRMVEPNLSAASGASSRYVRVDDDLWLVKGPSTDTVKHVPLDSALLTIEFLLPDSVAKRAIVPFAGGFEAAGSERHAGVATRHYRLTAAGQAAYARLMQLKGRWTGDLWIAKDGGYLVGFTLMAAPDDVDTVRAIDIRATVTDANDPKIKVTKPK